MSDILVRKNGKSPYQKALYIGGAVLVLLLTWWFLQPKMTAEVGKVERGEAISAVYGTLQIEPVVQTIVRAQNTGVISEVNVKKGDIVKEGEVLAKVADDAAAQQYLEAKTNYENAIRKRDIGAPSGPALESKRQQVAQLAKLLKEGNISQAEYDRNLSDQKILEDKVATEKLSLNADVETAKQKLDAAKNTIKQSSLLSPQDGVILDFYSQLGQVISSREEVFLIGSQQCQIRAQVNEEDVGSLKVGLPAIVRLYSHPGKNFHATLKEILPQGKTMEYSVLLTLQDPPDPFLPGMTGELNIIIGKHENSLIIPSRAIRNMPTPTVLTVDHGIVRSCQVKVGYHSIEKSEILDGLNEGDLVILSDQDLFKPGQRVNTRLHEQ